MNDLFKNSMCINEVELRTDDQGYVCLNDILKAAGNPEGKSLDNFHRLDSVKAFRKQVDITNVTTTVVKLYYSVNKGKSGSITFADTRYALLYAAWLSSALNVEIHETFLKLKLVPEDFLVDTFSKLDDVAQQRVLVRQLGIKARNRLTSALAEHGVKRLFGTITDDMYKIILGGTSKEIKAALDLKKTANLRVHLDCDELRAMEGVETLVGLKLKKSTEFGDYKCRRFIQRETEKLAVFLNE